MRRLIYIIMMLAVVAVAAGRKVKVPSARGRQVAPAVRMATFIVDSASNEDGIILNDVTFSRFDKPYDSTQESFVCSNASPRRLVGVSVRIDYMLTDGTRIHSRTVKLDCDIPAGETRLLTTPSFDRQQSYRYVGSRVPPRREATPFDVRMTAVRLIFAR